MTAAEKLALAQRSYAAFSAGGDVEALLALYHPECEWRMGSMGAAFATEAYRGHDGLRALASDLGEGFESFVVVIDEAKITREGALLLRGHGTGRSRGTPNGTFGFVLAACRVPRRCDLEVGAA